MLDDSSWSWSGSFSVINLSKFADVTYTRNRHFNSSYSWFIFQFTVLLQAWSKAASSLMLQPLHSPICKHSVNHPFLEKEGLLLTLLHWLATWVPLNLVLFAINLCRSLCTSKVWLLSPLRFLDTEVQWTYTMIKCISKRSFKCVLCSFVSSCSPRDHVPELCLDFASILNTSCSPSRQCYARAGFQGHMLVQPPLSDAFDWKMWLGNRTFACTVQLSDKHRCVPFRWPDAENTLSLLRWTLQTSKHFDLLHHLFFLQWQLPSNFISSCWSLFLALFVLLHFACMSYDWS